MRRLAKFLIVLGFLVLLPSMAFAQGQLAGVVKDTSGAVLPGVTVEAASPALIEKTRSVVTDGRGQYRIVDLRPGTYTVTFTLPGFNTVKREGVELSGAATVTVDAELRVGALEETITVSGEAPVVDVQSTQRQAVMPKDVVDSLPTGRTYYTLGVLVPGVNSTAKDVGGSTGDTMSSLTAHGGPTGDQRVLQNGLNVMTLQTGGGNIGGMVPNTNAASEVTIDTSAGAAERQTGGVVINFIPRDGGNTFKGSTFGTFSNEHMASDNFTQRLKDLGLTAVNRLRTNWDVNPGFGGPIKKDKVWFYWAGRYQAAEIYAPGMFANANAYKPNLWTYVADTSRPALSSNAIWYDSNLRVTWQANAKNKFAGTWDQQDKCECPRQIAPTRAPEAAVDYRFPTQRLSHAEWFSPITSKLLVEFVGVHRTERWGNMGLRADWKGATSDVPPFQGVSAPDLANFPLLVGVTEQSSGLQFHGPFNVFNNNWVPSYHYRGSVSYVTGTHAFKVGFNEAVGFLRNAVYLTNDPPVRYRFNNGVPNQLTEYTTPYEAKSDQNHDFGLYAQDRWTLNRLTLNVGFRYDWFVSSYPQQTLVGSSLFPNRAGTLAAEDNLNWKDVVPRIGGVYDPVGDGKTAIKVSINKYVAGQALGGLGSNTNPILRLTTNATRTWNDLNRDFVPNCDLTNLAPNGECLGISNTNLGTLNAGQVTDNALRVGWNVRPYNWEFSASVQRQLLPRVSTEVGFFRRWYGNFTVTDDLNLAPSDLQAFTITAPVDSRLPNGGGYPVTLYDRIPAAFGRPQNNSQRLSDSYGKQIEHWNGVDLSVNARLQNGVLLQGGVSTGHAVADYCEIIAKLPEMLLGTIGAVGGQTGVPNAWTSPQYCHVQEPWLTQVKAVGIYTVPKVDVQIAGTLQSIPGPIRFGVYNVPAAVAAAALGRPLVGNAANAPVNLLDTPAPFGTTGGTVYGDRLNQLDLRFAKILKYGRTRTNVSLDLFNAFNTDAVLTENPNYAALFQPTSVIQARFFKVSATFDF